MTTLAPADVQTALGQIGDLIVAWQAGFKDVGADEIVIEDALLDAARFAGGPVALLAPTLVPLLVPAIVAAVEQNQSASPGVLPPIGSSRKGSDPWQT